MATRDPFNLQPRMAAPPAPAAVLELRRVPAGELHRRARAALAGRGGAPLRWMGKERRPKFSRAKKRARRVRNGGRVQRAGMWEHTVTKKV